MVVVPGSSKQISDDDLNSCASGPPGARNNLHDAHRNSRGALNSLHDALSNPRDGTVADSGNDGATVPRSSEVRSNRSFGNRKSAGTTDRPAPLDR